MWNVVPTQPVLVMLSIFLTLQEVEAHCLENRINKFYFDEEFISKLNWSAKKKF